MSLSAVPWVSYDIIVNPRGFSFQRLVNMLLLIKQKLLEFQKEKKNHFGLQPLIFNFDFHKDEKY